MRKIIIAIISLGVWGAAIKIYLDRRRDHKQEAKSLIVGITVQPPAPPSFGPGKGEFETYFKEQSPLSNIAELLRRLILRPIQLQPTSDPAMPANITEGSYAVDKQIYRIYVPENASPAVPCGIIYYLGYKDALNIPAAWKADLDALHLIFISPKNFVRPEWQQAAVALDAMHNLKTQYKIDQKRIYLFEFPPKPGLIGLQMGLGLSDVFTGFAHIDRLEHYRSVPVPQLNRSYPPTLASPPPELLTISKSRPHVFVLQDNFYVANGLDRRLLFHAALERDGFAKLLFLDIADPEELHYPNFHGPWLRQTIQFLDTHAAGNGEPISP